MSLPIRRIQPDEGPRLRAIRLEALAESPSAFGSTFAETLVRSPEYWQRRAADNAAGESSVMFVAEDQGRWHGLAGAYLDDQDPSSADLISMWVRPDHRGQGLGRHLVDTVVAWARNRGLRGVALWVTESNADAIALYERCGFQVTGETQPLPSDSGLREQRMVLTL